MFDLASRCNLATALHVPRQAKYTRKTFELHSDSHNRRSVLIKQATLQNHKSLLVDAKWSGASIPLNQWRIMHIPPISTKFLNVPLFAFNLRFLLKFHSFASSLFWPWCIMYRALHILDAPENDICKCFLIFIVSHSALIFNASSIWESQNRRMHEPRSLFGRLKPWRLLAIRHR